MWTEWMIYRKELRLFCTQHVILSKPLKEHFFVQFTKHLIFIKMNGCYHYAICFFSDTTEHQTCMRPTTKIGLKKSSSIISAGWQVEEMKLWSTTICLHCNSVCFKKIPFLLKNKCFNFRCIKKMYNGFNRTVFLFLVLL